MSVTRKIKRALRGEVGLMTASLEASRRLAVALRRRSERALLSNRSRRDAASPAATARLAPDFGKLGSDQLLAHFRERQSPKFFPGFTAEFNRQRSPADTCFAEAEEILSHRWPLLGLDKIDFGAEIDWLRDPVSGARWPSDYHGDITLVRNDRSDVRVLWELNRLGHLLTLGQAYASSRDERFAEECFAQVESWQRQNPLSFGANWTCAMEAALRAMNLLGAFHFFRSSPAMNGQRLLMMLALFDEHARYIRQHLEFSYIATGNHYLSDVAGLLWLGICLPELADANVWREFGLRELLREMDKQVLPDGAHWESSTGYHRFVTELLLYSFVLCRANGIEIGEKYWQRLHAMLEYIRAYLRPDGRAPLIGDSDGGQVLPLVRHAADDHAYLLALSAAVFHEPRFKILAARVVAEVGWILGEQGLRDFEALPATDDAHSIAFPDAGTYILRDDDLYLLFNAGGNGMNGRGSHGHNDALSIEVAACGTAFIVDPGSYVYTGDLKLRHAFRSTAYHSTVEVDGTDQNVTEENEPFVIGNEAHPRVLRCEFFCDRDVVAAEHNGYARLPDPVTHQRVVQLDKRGRLWKIVDSLHGKGEHNFRFVFGLAPEVEPVLRANGVVQIRDTMSGAQLLLALLDRDDRPEFVERWTSRDYGAKSSSRATVWSMQAHMPFVVRWAIVPVCESDHESSRLELIEKLRSEGGQINFGVKS
jgi:Heparinase II/III N-terminus/Heparinase II/III-like protein